MSTAEILQAFHGAVTQFAKVDAHGEFGPVLVLRADFADTATGDVDIFVSNAPFAFRVIDAWIENTGANTAVANTIQICAGAGATDDISDIMSLNAVADKTIVRALTLDDAFTVDEGGSLYLRQTKAGGAMGGTVWMKCVTL